MNVKKITLNKKRRPSKVTVQMSVDEAATVAKVFGGMSPSSFSEKYPLLEPETQGEIYSCLVGEFFNRFWEDGVDGAIAGEKF